MGMTRQYAIVQIGDTSMKLSQIVKGPREIFSDVGPSQTELWSPDLRMPQFC